MKNLVVSLVLLCAVSVFAQHHNMSSAKPVTLVTGLGNLHHPV